MKQPGMNRIQKFLELSGIANGNRHGVDERASYFVWYHTMATGQLDADLQIVSEYLIESGTTPPDLHELYQTLSAPSQLVERSPIPGRLRMRRARVLDEYLDPVFRTKGLAPLYFFRGTDGRIIRIGSRKEALMMWPQRHWFAAWIAFALGVLGVVLSLISLLVPPRA